MITRSDLLSINDKYRTWLINDTSFPPERDLSVQLTVKSKLHTPLKQTLNYKQEKTLNPDNQVQDQDHKREETLNPDINL